MDMLHLEPLDLLLIVGILFLAAVAQSAVGFGYALFASPLLVAIGLPLQNVIVLVSSCSMVQSTMGAIKLREHVPWNTSCIATGVRLVAVIVGVFLLKELITFSTANIRMVIGLILCGLVFLQIVFRPKPVKRLHWAWGGLAFSASGILAGVCGMGGPPLVVWSMAHDWTTQKTRGFLFSVFAMCIPLQVVILAITFGSAILWYTVLALCSFPVIYLGNRIGLPIGNRMAKERLRLIAYAILLVIGISAAVPAMMSHS